MNLATAYFQGWIKGGRLDLRLEARLSVSDMNVWTFIISFTFIPFGSKIIGSPVVLQTFRRIVVLPALARPITRIRNWLNLSRVFWISLVERWGCDEVDIAKGTLRRCWVWTKYSTVTCHSLRERTEWPSRLELTHVFLLYIYSCDWKLLKKQTRWTRVQLIRIFLHRFVPFIHPPWAIYILKRKRSMFITHKLHSRPQIPFFQSECP